MLLSVGDMKKIIKILKLNEKKIIKNGTIRKKGKYYVKKI